MKKASLGKRRSSATGRNTFGGGSTLGRQNSFGGNDLRFSRGMEKKSMLLKPGFSSKRSVSLDNLSVNDPKRWSSTVKKPANPSRQTIVRSTGNMNITGINKVVASTPRITPRLNPNLPETNSSNKNRRLSTDSRYSYYGVVKNRKEIRPLTEKDFQQAAIHKIQNYFLTAPNASHILNNGSLKSMTTNMFTDMCEYLLHELDRNQQFNKSKYMEELPKIMKKYYYKGKVDKSWLITVNASHSFPQVVGLLLWLVELCETQCNFDVMESLYPTTLDRNEVGSEEYEQILEFKTYLPFLLHSYQVETRASGKHSDKEFLQKQEDLLLENYKKILGVEESLSLVKLEAEVANYKEEISSLCYVTEEKNFEEMKTMKVALLQDMKTTKQYIKDMKVCIGDTQEHVSKKENERVFQEKIIENLQKELDVVSGCINGQTITQGDKKIIEEDIISLKQDIKYEENCYEEYLNIVYSEYLNTVNVRLKLDKLFVQYNKLCVENIVVLPELENALADKNVLAPHVRESLKVVDENLKSLKNKKADKLNTMERKLVSLQKELDSVMFELNNLKRVADKLNTDHDDDKKSLMEISERQSEVRKEYERKLYDLQADIKSNEFDKTDVENKTEEKNYLLKLISEEKNDKNKIFMMCENYLKKHLKVFEETRNVVQNAEIQHKEAFKLIKERQN